MFTYSHVSKEVTLSNTAGLQVKFSFMFSESGREFTRPNNAPGDSRGSPAPGTDGGSSADLSSSLSQSTEDVSQDMVG